MSSTTSFAAPAVSVLQLSRRRLGVAGTLVVLALCASLLAVAFAQFAVSLMGGDRLLAALCALGGTLPPAVLLGTLLLQQQPIGAPAQSSSNPQSPDPLTGLMQRGPFIWALDREWRLARRHRNDLSVVLIDIDHLKCINDAYGKRCGDEVLRRVAVSCSRALRGSDVLARFGGEEFIILLPQTDPLGALDMADRLRQRVAGLDLDWLGHSINVQVSVGVASLRDEHVLLDQLLHETDQALQQAKTAGRNCVRALDAAPTTQPSRVR